jgi:hypothetical protein
MACIDLFFRGRYRSIISPISKILRLLIPTCLGLLLTVSVPADAKAETPQTEPTGWQTSYTQIHFDDLETLVPSVGSSLILTNIGSLTDDPAEVIDGIHSIKGIYTGAEAYLAYLQSDPYLLPLTPLQSDLANISA